MDDPDGMRPGNLDGRRVVARGAASSASEEGVALILALVSMLVLTIMLTAVHLHDGRRRARRAALERGPARLLARGVGINNALAVLEANYPGTVGYPGDNTLLTTCPASLPTVCPCTSTYATGTVTGPGRSTTRLAGLGWSDQWNITSIGYRAEPDRPDGRAGHANGHGRSSR